MTDKESTKQRPLDVQEPVKFDKRLYEQSLKSYRESRVFLAFLDGKYKSCH